jgi:hypothetical protein
VAPYNNAATYYQVHKSVRRNTNPWRLLFSLYAPAKNFTHRVAVG